MLINQMNFGVGQSNDKLDIDLFASIGHHNKVKMALTLCFCKRLFEDLTNGV